MALQDLKQKFGGKWLREKTENLEEFCKIMDLDADTKKLLMESSLMEEYKTDGDYVIMICSVGPHSGQNKFKLNEEYEEDRMGTKMKSICRYEDGKIIIKSTAADNPEVKSQTVTIEKISDDKNLSTVVMGDNNVVYKVYFKRV